MVIQLAVLNTFVSWMLKEMGLSFPSISFWFSGVWLTTLVAFSLGHSNLVYSDPKSVHISWKTPRMVKSPWSEYEWHSTRGRPGYEVWFKMPWSDDVLYYSSKNFNFYSLCRIKYEPYTINHEVCTLQLVQILFQNNCVSTLDHFTRVCFFL